VIWKTIHIASETCQGKDFIHKQIHRQSDFVPGNDSIFNVGIVGGGPKGLYALEELFSRIKDEKISGNWQILWFNDTEDFGCGPNYQVDQPDYLLINYCIGHVDAWDRTKSASKNYLNFMDWIQKFRTDERKVKPTDFASRALVGHYLQYVTMQVIGSRSENIQLRLIPEKVRNIESNSEGKLWTQTDNGDYRLDNVLLTTGHCYRNLPLIDFQENSIPENYLTAAYPVQVLDKIPPKKKVGIIGWGLTCIDAALQLTEGRGGHFDKADNYIPSGNEPVLLPFSRNHLPIMPRGPIYGENTYKLHYLNEKWFDEIQTIQKQRKIDFRTEIFPWLERELNFAYYSTQLQTREASDVEAYITSLPEKERFSYRDLLFPNIPQTGKLQESYVRYVEFLISEAEKGELKSPLMAAAAVWREASPFIANIYREGGFTGESQKFLDKELFGSFCRTSYGPPIENMKKIKALMIAGIIQVQWETAVELTYYIEENQFILQSEENRENVDFIIDARIARPNLSVSNSELYQNLWKNKLVELYQNDGYRPGCVKMNAIGKVLTNEKDIPLYVYGSNTEGFLLDNDSLSRKKNNLASNWATDTLEQHRKILVNHN